MGYGKSGMGGQHPIMKHMTKAGGGTGTSQSMSKNADIKYGGSVIDQFKSPAKNIYEAPIQNDEKQIGEEAITGLPGKITKKGFDKKLKTIPPKPVT